MLHRYSKDESERFEVENDVDGLLLIFEYFGTLVDELVDLKDSVFLLVHVLDESLDESSQLLAGRDDVSLVHLEVKNDFVILL